MRDRCTHDGVVLARVSVRGIVCPGCTMYGVSGSHTGSFGSENSDFGRKPVSFGSENSDFGRKPVYFGSECTKNSVFWLRMHENQCILHPKHSVFGTQNTVYLAPRTHGFGTQNPWIWHPGMWHPGMWHPGMWHPGVVYLGMWYPGWCT